MDLMIDCMPLYEMIEDDMKNIAANLNNSNLLINSNSASPSCLSDEEQLALTSCSIFDDLFFFTPTTTTSNTSTNSNHSNNNNSNNNTNTFEQITSVKIENDFNQRSNYNCTLSLNESFNSSNSSSNSSSSSSSAVCSPLSSPLSLSLSSSSLCAALASTNFSTINTSSSQHQQQNWDLSQLIDNNQYSNSNTYQSNNQLNTDEEHQSVSPVNTQSVLQDSYMNNNFSLFHVINPLDLNRNYTSNNLNILQSQDLKQHQNDNKQNSKQSNLSYTHQQIKRSKFTHTNTSQSSTATTTSASTTNLQLKQETLFNSDGESTGSNESNDSNSSYGSNNIDYSKQQHLIKIEPFQLKNLTNDLDANSNQVQLHQQQPQILNVNNTTQINLIKINNPKENKTNSTTTLNNLINNSNSTCLKLPITTTKLNDNHKTIIQYKQLLNNNNNSNPIKQQQQQQNSIANTNTSNKTNCTNLQLTNNSLITSSRNDVIKVYPKPPYSYSCLIAMALRNSDTGNLPVSDIYDFIIENFPYYKTARDGWKNSIRHNLSLNKCFEKIENPTNGSKKGCLWALNPDKCKKLEEECKRCRQRDPINIRLSMSRPDDLNKIERGEQRIKKFSNQNNQRKTCDTTTSSNQANVLSPTISLNQTTDQLLTNDSFLLEWANNKNSTFILKEEDDADQYFDNSDIKFDSILLSTISPTTIRNKV